MQPRGVKKRKNIILYVLGAILIMLGLSVIIYAASPLLSYYFLSEKIPYPSRLHPERKAVSEEIPKDNRLVIPKINVNINIVQGGDESALLKGAWHYPGSAVPGEDSNNIITGHRFQFGPGSSRTFYLLDKIDIGDDLIIYWEGKEFDYKVTKVYEVEPDQIEILKRGNEEKLTIFTCTPLFTQDRRLVLEAERILSEDEIKEKEKKESEAVKKIRVKETDIGYLNVRSGPGTSFDKMIKVKAGEELKELERQKNEKDEEWIKVQLNLPQDEDVKEGWVISEYAEEIGE